MEYRYETRVFEVKEIGNDKAAPELYSELAFVRFFGFKEGLEINADGGTQASCLPKAIACCGIKEGSVLRLRFKECEKLKRFDATVRVVHEVKYT